MSRVIVKISENRNDIYCIQLDEMNFSYHNANDLSKSNYPIKVLDNNNGKIIISAVGFLRITQLAMEFMKTLIKKDDFVDYKYVKNNLLPKLIKKIEANHIQTIRDEFGQLDAPISIVIIANGKVYKIERLVYVSENDSTFATASNLEAFVRIKEGNGELETLKDMFNTIKEYADYVDDVTLPIVYCNDEDFMVKIQKEEW